MLASDALALDPKTPIGRCAHDRWDARDGLPEGAVFAVLHGADGYLWLGTQFGIVRFDGARFTLFEEGQLGLKQHSFARRLVEGPDGSIWAALVGGVARYRGGRFAFFDEQQGLLHPFVYALAPGPDGSLWVGTGGSGLWQLRDGRFEHHPAYREPGLPAQVNDIAVDRQGTVWVAAGDGVATLGPSARRFTVADGLGSAVANAALVDRRATFRIYLRVAEALPPERRQAVAKELPQGQGRVLVMDDEPIVLEIAMAALEHLGYTVEGASDGERAHGRRGHGRSRDAGTAARGGARHSCDRHERLLERPRARRAGRLRFQRNAAEAVHDGRAGDCRGCAARRLVPARVCRVIRSTVPGPASSRAATPSTWEDP